MSGSPLAGRRVVITRDDPGRLEALLAATGAEVLHVPLIEIGEPADAGAALATALADLAAFDWVVVTSRHGARRVAEAVAAHPDVRTATVGAATAAVLAGATSRPVDVVPPRQTAADLVAAMPPPRMPGERVLVAQADRADRTLVAGLADRGFDVVAVTAYATRLRRPPAGERAAALAADAVAFASGSAAEAWAAAIGPETPAVVVTIGPTTARAARAAGLAVTHVAGDHSVEGLAAAVAAALGA